MSNVLIIDDEPSICWGLEKLCQQLGWQATTVSSAERGIDVARSSTFDIVVLDVRLPGMDGLSAIQPIQEQLGAVPIVIMTAFGDLQTAIEAVKQGAHDYVLKPFELEQMRKVLQRAQATAAIQRDSREGQSSLEQIDLQPLVGSSPMMQEVYKQLAYTTTSKAPVLITGESGTGKELTARSIHQFGNRFKGPFVAVNIAALNPSLAESELFGHVQGAFTGADSDRQGLIQQAHGGTLFLDEVAEIPIEIQVKLLRVLDQNEVTPVGSSQPVRTDFRLISATNQDLLAMVNQGRFRLDLFYRLRTFEIRLPALRERKEDIPELVSRFIQAHAKTHNAESGVVAGTGVTVSESFLDRLNEFSWPGNVRQLQSAVDRAVALARGGVLTADHVERPDDVTILSAEKTDVEPQIQELVKRWAREHWDDGEERLYDQLMEVIDPAILQTAFDLSSQQYSAAARRLGIHRTTLKRKLDQGPSEPS